MKKSNLEDMINTPAPPIIESTIQTQTTMKKSNLEDTIDTLEDTIDIAASPIIESTIQTQTTMKKSNLEDTINTLASPIIESTIQTCATVSPPTNNTNISKRESTFVQILIILFLLLYCIYLSLYFYLLPDEYNNIVFALHFVQLPSFESLLNLSDYDYRRTLQHFHVRDEQLRLQNIDFTHQQNTHRHINPLWYEISIHDKQNATNELLNGTTSATSNISDDIPLSPLAEHANDYDAGIDWNEVDFDSLLSPKK